MRHFLLSLLLATLLVGCGNLRASILGNGANAYTASYTDLRGQPQTLSVSFEMQGDVIQEFHLEASATGEERGHQLAAEANARKYLVGKVASEVILPDSVGDEAQKPVTEALREVLEQLKGDLEG